MITQIKRSIPDLRSIKHQPLENKESPTGSPKHAQNHHHQHFPRPAGAAIAAPDQLDAIQRSSFEKDTDAITLSAIQSTSCTCGAKADLSTAVDKNAISDDPDAFSIPIPHSTSHLPHNTEVR